MSVGSVGVRSIAPIIHLRIHTTATTATTHQIHVVAAPGRDDTWNGYGSYPLRKDYPLRGVGERENYKIVTREGA